MPKLKTKRSAAKRFGFTKTGKVKMKRSKLRHILTTKTTKQKRRLRSPGTVAGADKTRLKRLMPYG